MAKKVTKPSDDNIKFLCGLIRDVARIDECLDDLNISTTSTFSSVKITQLAQDVKHSLEQYVQSSINGLTHLKKKKVNVLPSNEDAEDNVLYLIKDTTITDDNIYSQYLLIDGVLEPLGATHTNFDNYYKKSEADLKFALLADLQTLINAIGSISELKTTKKDTLVNAINEIKEGLDDYLTKTEVENKYATIESLEEVLDMIGDEKMTTMARTTRGAINELAGRNFLAVQLVENTSILDFAKTYDILSHNFFYSCNCTDCPPGTNGFCYFSIEVSNDPLYRYLNAYDPTSGRIFTNVIGANADGSDFGEWSGWKKFINNSDIIDELTENSTNDEILGAEALYRELNKVKYLYCNDANSDNLKNTVYAVDEFTTNIISPGTGFLINNRYLSESGDLDIRYQLYISIEDDIIYSRKKTNNNNWSEWKNKFGNSENVSVSSSSVSQAKLYDLVADTFYNITGLEFDPLGKMIVQVYKQDHEYEITEVCKKEYTSLDDINNDSEISEEDNKLVIKTEIDVPTETLENKVVKSNPISKNDFKDYVLEISK